MKRESLLVAKKSFLFSLLKDLQKTISAVPIEKAFLQKLAKSLQNKCEESQFLVKFLSLSKILRFRNNYF